MGFRRLNKAERVAVGGKGNNQAIRLRGTPKEKWVLYRAKHKKNA